MFYKIISNCSIIEWNAKFGYPGSFDPWTKGHLSVITSLLDKDPDAKIEIIIAKNPDKAGLFLPEERKFIIENSIPQKYLDRVRVTIVQGIVASYMFENNIPYFIKGIRDSKDYSYETELALLNNTLYGSPLTLLIPQMDMGLSHVSSSNLKLLTNIGVPLDRYAPAYVRELLKMKTTGKLMIGVTGGISSGKSTLCKTLSTYSMDKDTPIHYINMDALGHVILTEKENVLPLYKKVRSAIAEMFGHNVLEADGTINRKLLGDIVFADKNKLDQLTDLMLEPILFLMGKRIQKIKTGIIFLESAILVDRKLTELVDENMIIVAVDKDVQKQRMIEIRGLEPEQADKRIESQLPQDAVRQSIADLQTNNYDRLLLQLSGNEDLNMDTIEYFYYQLKNEYIRRNYTRRDNMIYIIPELKLKNDKLFLDEIARLHQIPERGYHTIMHVMEMLCWFHQIKDKLEHPLEVYLAIIFHDIIYDAALKDNEEQSAELAKKLITKHVMNEDINVDLIVRLIQLSAKHLEDLKDLTNDEKIFLDMDMGIFAAPKKRLLTCEGGVYKEYGKIYPLEAYIKGRSMFLNSLLLPEKSIFRSELFKEKYEDLAKANIKYLLTQVYAENPIYIKQTI
ncbi:MAG: dephospho-CoA kinase [Candidatus Margulisbacteria bacterium]|nr:dephospho-CoA kinase [Candidatus Margulisiibacteriota bacterium]